MDGNWDALIYIVLSIIIFAVSVMRKKKKRVSPLNIDEGVNQKQNIFDLLTGQQSYEEEIEMQEESKEIQPAETEIKNNEQINRTISDKSVEKEVGSRTNLDERQDEIEEIEQDDFDLRQAVIYSEILNRKLF